MRIKNRTRVGFMAFILFLSACNTNISSTTIEDSSVATFSDIAGSHSETITNESSKLIDSAENSNSNVESSYNYLFRYEKNSTRFEYTTLISFNETSVSINRLGGYWENELGVNLKNGFFQGQLGYGMGHVFTYDLMNEQIYESEFWASDLRNIELLENDVVAIVCRYQYQGNEENKLYDSDNMLVPLLLDKYCQPLPPSDQLKFDYGKAIRYNKEDYDFIYGEDRIIALAYDSSKEQYIAVFTKNAYLFLDDPIEWNTANAMCEMGVTIFDKHGNQLEKYRLPGTSYPQFSSSRRSPVENPELTLTEDNHLLIVPRMPVYKEESAPLVVCVNLSSRDYCFWEQEQMETFLLDSPNYDGEVEAYWYDKTSKQWNIREVNPPVPFEMIYDKTAEGEVVTLVKMADDENVLFALPGKVITEAWTQSKDGMIHALVAVKKQM